MTMSKPRFFADIKNLLPLILILFLVAGYMITGYLTLEPEPRRVPVLTGYLTLLLIAFELVRQYLSPDIITDNPNPVEHNPEINIKKETKAVLYVCALVAGIYLAGFLITVPLYLFASIAWLGKQSIRMAITITVPASIAIYLVFEVMLEYQLFKGVLLS